METKLQNHKIRPRNNKNNHHHNNNSTNNNPNGRVIYNYLYTINNCDLYNNTDNYGDHQINNIPRCSRGDNTITTNNEYVETNLIDETIKLPYLYTNNTITTTTTTEEIVNNHNNSDCNKLINSNRRNREWHHHQRRFRNNAGRSPKEYESDESCSSYSSRGTPDNLQNHEDYDDNNKKSLIFTHNFYQPISETVKNKLSLLSYQRTNNNRNNNNNNNNNQQQIKNNKNSDIILRRAHGLMERFKSRAYRLRINLNPIDLLIGHSSVDQLNQSIWDVFIHNIQKEETYIKKLNLWKQMFLYIRKVLNSYGLFLVGSTMSGCALEGSDIDMCLLTKPFNNDPRIDSLHHLSYLKQLLTNDGIASNAELIMAKVPILKFKNNESGFEVDLNCNNGVGIQNTQLLYTYAQLDWRVRPLIIIVKLWAQANNINNAKNMTISSYSWSLMVIHYLQCGMSPPVLPCLHDKLPSKFNTNQINQHQQYNYGINDDLELINNYKSNNKNCLGDLLIGFFKYYSKFDYTKYVISVRTGKLLLIDDCRYVKTPKNDPNQWKCLCIEEPFNLSNTARSVFDPDIFENIKNIILTTYEILSETKMLSYIFPINLHR